MPKVEVLWFASLSDITGTRKEVVEHPEGESLEQFFGRMTQRFPDLAERKANLRVAIDSEWADWDVRLHECREIAFIPPVSGG